MIHHHTVKRCTLKPNTGQLLESGGWERKAASRRDRSFGGDGCCESMERWQSTGTPLCEDSSASSCGDVKGQHPRYRPTYPSGVLEFTWPESPLLILESFQVAAGRRHSLGLLGNRSARPVLIKTIQDFDNAPEVRYAAARALGMLAKTSDLPLLEKLAADYPELHTRRVLLAA